VTSVVSEEIDKSLFNEYSACEVESSSEVHITVAEFLSITGAETALITGAVVSAVVTKDNNYLNHCYCNIAS